MNSDETQLRLLKLWHVIGALMVAYIVYVSLTPNPIPMPGRWTDKVFHFAGYFSVMAWYRQLPVRRNLMAAVFILMGIGLEFGQMLVKTRSFEWADMTVNILGVLVAAFVFRGSLARLLMLAEKIVLVRRI